jgi:uncharacterized protein YndB with AHSA1/START domain
MAVSSVANSETFRVTTPSDREIVFTRLFSAPRRLVFEAMTRPEHVRQWWGILDDRYTLTVCDIDLRPGGAWRWVGRGPQGPFAFRGEYREIAPPDRLVYTEIYEPFPDVESEVRAIFADEHGKTRLTVTASYPSREVRDAVMKTGMESGAAISYDRLEEVARKLAQSAAR